MPDADTIGTWRGHELIDRDGEKIGKIAEIYLDRQTEQPGWVTVKTGLFGRRETLVPITDASSEGDIVRVPFEKEHVNGAPHVDPEAEMSADEERALHEHYGLDYSSDEDQDQTAGAGQEHAAAAGQEGGDAAAAEQARPGGGDDHEGGQDASRDRGGGDAAEHATSGGGGDHEGGRDASRDRGGGDAAEHATSGGGGEDSAAAGKAGSDTEESDSRVGARVSEEPVGGERGETRLRLKRYVVTEEVRVPVQREEVRLERDDEGGDQERPDQERQGPEGQDPERPT
ncbi:MAG TPA: PRC-barrel domain-containing protein [Thermoleophilaceae bacterium]|nr:PRC-barrel domain-containing protein [Thermoleophilaceae bacterium]